MSRNMNAELKTEKIIESMADDLAKKMYYKFVFLKYLPEINEIEKGRKKALKNKEIEDFLDKC
ncbi:MAG: hypothetical protein N3D75_03835 [Candidatus Aenigmarchaeota archaeon]|nr:hypothetical protein [Candidatus Aenigmarchaeota archaeon]